MIELATKTITAESRMGSHKDMIGTTVPPCESALGNACAVLDSPKPTPVGQASQPTHDPDRTRKAFLTTVGVFSPTARLPKPLDRDHARRAAQWEGESYHRCCQLRRARFGAGRSAWRALWESHEISPEILLPKFPPTMPAQD